PPRPIRCRAAALRCKAPWSAPAQAGPVAALILRSPSLLPPAQRLQLLPVRYAEDEGDEQEIEVRGQRQIDQPGGADKAEASDDAGRPDRPKESAQPGAVLLTAVQRVGGEHVEEPQGPVDPCQHRGGVCQHPQPRKLDATRQRGEREPETQIYGRTGKKDDRACEDRARQRTLEVGQASKPDELYMRDMSAERPPGEGVPQL